MDINDGKLDEYFEMDVNEKGDVVYIESNVDEKAFKGESFTIFKKNDKDSKKDCKSKCKSSCKSSGKAKIYNNGNSYNSKGINYNMDILLTIKVPKNMILDI